MNITYFVPQSAPPVERDSKIGLFRLPNGRSTARNLAVLLNVSQHKVTASIYYYNMLLHSLLSLLS